MRTVAEIQRELGLATAKRSELWQRLGHERSGSAQAEAARLTTRISELWAELRTARARERFGSPEFIVRRAERIGRAERELERRLSGGLGERRAA